MGSPISARGSLAGKHWEPVHASTEGEDGGPPAWVDIRHALGTGVCLVVSSRAASHTRAQRSSARQSGTQHGDVTRKPSEEGQQPEWRSEEAPLQFLPPKCSDCNSHTRTGDLFK